MRASRRRARRHVLVALGLLVPAVPGIAHAYCRTMTQPVPADYQPTSDGCWNQGVPLWWRNACVGYDIQKDASRQVSYDDAAQTIAAAFAKWTGASCPSTGSSSRVSVDVRDLGPVDCGLVQYNSDQGNQHVIVFRDDGWPHNDSSNTLALTTVVFDPDTGEIYDADMEINTYAMQGALALADPVPPNGYDFASVVTHETGHFLGMAHSGDPHATMYAHYTQGSTAMRSLTSDDVAGICSIYPPDGTRGVATSVSSSGTIPEDACDPTPRHGFSKECASPQSTSKCSVSTPGAEGAWGILLAAGALAITMLRRRTLGGSLEAR